MDKITLFTITFNFGDEDYLMFRDIEIAGCYSVQDIRAWINGSQPFVDIKDQLINLSKVCHIHIIKKGEATDGGN